MNESYLRMLILYCLAKINGQRTIYAVLHLLNGKKSSQTIQDAHLFQLTKLFQTFPALTRLQLEEMINELAIEGFIVKNAEHCELSSLGKKEMAAFFARKPLPKDLNGWKFHQLANLFWERLSLAVQVISHLSCNSPAKYIPIQKKREIQLWIKRFLQETKLSRSELSAELFKELTECLEESKEISPSILVIRLTGKDIFGFTSQQAADRLGSEHSEYHIQFLGILHFMLASIQKDAERFPLLNRFIPNIEDSLPLTLSTQKTYSLLKKGKNAEEISQIRALKKSTIEDHIVEIALNISHFDITSFVEKQKQALIRNAIRKGKSKQLKQIRGLVPTAEYFEIRLVLAKFGERK